MDLTALISSWSNSVVTVVARFFHEYWGLGVFFLPAGLLFARKKKALVLALALALLLVPVLKSVYAQPRPCANLKVECEQDYGFPSAHAVVAFVFAAASVGSWLFFLFLPAAVFVAFSRVYLGVHSFEQVAGGVALGVVLFFVADAIVERISSVFEGVFSWRKST